MSFSTKTADRSSRSHAKASQGCVRWLILPSKESPRRWSIGGCRGHPRITWLWGARCQCGRVCPVVRCRIGHFSAHPPTRSKWSAHKAASETRDDLDSLGGRGRRRRCGWRAYCSRDCASTKLLLDGRAPPRLASRRSASLIRRTNSQETRCLQSAAAGNRFNFRAHCQLARPLLLRPTRLMRRVCKWNLIPSGTKPTDAGTP